MHIDLCVCVCVRGCFLVFVCVLVFVECVQVFMINLQRRTDRRERMLRTLRLQGIDCKIVPAVDGKYVVFFQNVHKTACYQAANLDFYIFVLSASVLNRKI